MATPSLPESAFVTDLDGAIIIPKPDDVARWRDRIAKMDRDWNVPLSEEGDACGWSSAVLERGLALRRRRGAGSSSRRGCGLVVGAAAVADYEHNCSGKKTEPMTFDAIAAKAAVQRDIDNSFLAHFYLNVL